MDTAAVTDAALTAVASTAGPSVEKMSSRKRGHNSRTQRRNARGQFAPEPVFIDIYSDSESERDSDWDFNVKPATMMTPM